MGRSGVESDGELVDPRSLVPWADNPKKISEAMVTKLADSIEALGWGRSILARRSDRTIIAGHRATRAALLLQTRDPAKWARVPVRWVEVDDEQLRAMALADQRHAEDSEWDEVALAELLDDMSNGDRVVAGFRVEDVAAAFSPSIPRGALPALKLRVMVDVADEQDQTSLIARLEAEGYTCQPMNL